MSAPESGNRKKAGVASAPRRAMPTRSWFARLIRMPRLQHLLLLTLLLAATSAHSSAYRSLVVSEEGLGPIRLGMKLSTASDLLGIDIEQSAFHYGDASCSSYALGASQRDWELRFIVVGGKIGKIDVYTKDIRTSHGVGVGSSGAEVKAAYSEGLRILPAHDPSESTIQVKTDVGTVLEFTGQQARRTPPDSGLDAPTTVERYSVGLPGAGTVEGCL